MRLETRLLVCIFDLRHQVFQVWEVCRCRGRAIIKSNTYTHNTKVYVSDFLVQHCGQSALHRGAARYLSCAPYVSAVELCSSFDPVSGRANVIEKTVYICFTTFVQPGVGLRVLKTLSESTSKKWKQQKIVCDTVHAYNLCEPHCDCWIVSEMELDVLIGLKRIRQDDEFSFCYGKWKN